VAIWRPAQVAPVKIAEIGGRKNGPDPTRYGDWEKERTLHRLLVPQGLT